MKKTHKPIHNLQGWAHPAKSAAPKASQNFPTTKASTQSNTMKLIGKSAAKTGKRGKA